MVLLILQHGTEAIVASYNPQALGAFYRRHDQGHAFPMIRRFELVIECLASGQIARKIVAKEWRRHLLRKPNPLWSSV
jgi:hypothetical protein